MGEAAESYNTANLKNTLKILAIPSIRLELRYLKQYNKVSEEKALHNTPI